MSETRELFLIYDDDAILIKKSPETTYPIDYIYTHQLPRGLTNELHKNLPLRIVVPAHAVKHALLWVCGVVLPRMAKKMGV